MKIPTAALSIAALSLAMLTPSFGQTPSQSATDAQPGAREAQHLVPARASLPRTLDSNSVHTGDQFRATLTSNVHLSSGVELRKGDTLQGEVVTDDMNTPGNTRLAVRFTQAVQKNGQTIPIKATIVALYNPNNLLQEGYETEQVPNDWNDGTLSVDQLGVVNGVDLHSKIASQNSGVFVTNTKKDVKIPAGSEIALAIGPQANSGANLGD